jgi:hypothetical protein
MGLPLSMMYVTSLEGLLQRLMFLTAYGWYGAEALRLLKGAKP